MTVKQIRRVLEESLSLPMPYREIWILGGEPTLHPKLSEIIGVLDTYRNQVNGCTITFWTHGWGNRAERVLRSLPAWVDITISAKVPGKAPDGFNPFALAPLDYTDICPDNYEDGCSYVSPENSGIGVSRHGIYVCAVAGAIDRVVGLDIGLRSLREVSNRRFREQCKALCGYCGHFLVENGVLLENVSMSKTWREVVTGYHRAAPVLTLY